MWKVWDECIPVRDGAYCTRKMCSKLSGVKSTISGWHWTIGTPLIFNVWFETNFSCGSHGSVLERARSSGSGVCDSAMNVQHTIPIG